MIRIVGGLLAGASASAAYALSDVDAPAEMSEVRAALRAFIAQDIKAENARRSSPCVMLDLPIEGKPVVLDPYVAREAPLPEVPPPHHFETELQRFQRTGTIYERVGKVVTTTFFVDLDYDKAGYLRTGIGLRFKW